MIELSIVIVTWNTKKLLSDCIESIVSKKHKVNYEIIIVDNGSTDGTIEYLDNLNSKKGFKIIKNSKNEGFAKANNKGIKQARGEYILLLNSDTKVLDSALDQMYEFAKVTPGAGVVGARLLNADGSTQASCFNFPTLINTIQEYWLGQKGRTSKYFPKGDEPSVVDAVVGAAFLITPNARKKVGLLDERFFFFFEDLDYCRSVKFVGLKTYYLPSAQVTHYHGSTVRKITDVDDAWRKLVPGSKIYHGLIIHNMISFVMWTSQKWQKLLKILN